MKISDLKEEDIEQPSIDVVKDLVADNFVRTGRGPSKKNRVPKNKMPLLNNLSNESVEAVETTDYLCIEPVSFNYKYNFDFDFDLPPLVNYQSLNNDCLNF